MKRALLTVLIVTLATATAFAPPPGGSRGFGDCGGGNGTGKKGRGQSAKPASGGSGAHPSFPESDANTIPVYLCEKAAKSKIKISFNIKKSGDHTFVARNASDRNASGVVVLCSAEVVTPKEFREETKEIRIPTLKAGEIYRKNIRWDLVRSARIDKIKVKKWSQIVVGFRCKACKDSGLMRCPNCHGARTVACKKCGSAGYIIVKETIKKGTWEETVAHKAECPECHGVGDFPCHICGQAGTMQCTKCDYLIRKNEVQAAENVRTAQELWESMDDEAREAVSAGRLLVNMSIEAAIAGMKFRYGVEPYVAAATQSRQEYVWHFTDGETGKRRHIHALVRTGKIVSFSEVQSEEPGSEIKVKHRL